jgi:hypothetical protein
VRVSVKDTISAERLLQSNLNRQHVRFVQQCLLKDDACEPLAKRLAIRIPF